MKKILITITLIVSTLLSNQELKIDLDNDGKIDSVILKYYEKENRILYTLSSLGSKIFKSDALESYASHVASLEKTKNGFKYKEGFMRGGNASQFRYEKQSKKMQLIGMEHYEFGNGTHVGRGESSINLLTGKYVAQWAYVNYKKKALIIPPSTKKYYKFKKIYLDDFSFMMDKYYELDSSKEDVFPLKNKPIKLQENISFDAKGDLNKDALEDGIEVREEKNGDRTLNIYIGTKKGFKLVASSKHIVYAEDEGGGRGDPYMGVVIKNGYFSVEHYGGAAHRWKNITTFKYIAAKKNWFLHKESSGRYVDKEDLDEVSWKIKTVKDFGLVLFDEYDK